MSDEAGVKQHVYPNGLVLVSETMPSVRSASFTLFLPAGAAFPLQVAWIKHDVPQCGYCQSGHCSSGVEPASAPGLPTKASK